MDEPYHYIDAAASSGHSWVRIFDRRQGHGRSDNNHIAEVQDVDMAHRIVRLLNDDERLKEQAALTQRNKETSK